MRRASETVTQAAGFEKYVKTSFFWLGSRSTTDSTVAQIFPVVLDRLEDDTEPVFALYPRILPGSPSRHLSHLATTYREKFSLPRLFLYLDARRSSSPMQSSLTKIVADLIQQYWKIAEEPWTPCCSFEQGCERAIKACEGSQIQQTVRAAVRPEEVIRMLSNLLQHARPCLRSCRN